MCIFPFPFFFTNLFLFCIQECLSLHFLLQLTFFLFIFLSLLFFLFYIFFLQSSSMWILVLSFSLIFFSFIFFSRFFCIFFPFSLQVCLPSHCLSHITFFSSCLFSSFPSFSLFQHLFSLGISILHFTQFFFFLFQSSTSFFFRFSLQVCVSSPLVPVLPRLNTQAGISTHLSRGGLRQFSPSLTCLSPSLPRPLSRLSPSLSPSYL